MQKKEADKEHLIGIVLTMDKVKTIVQRPCSLEDDALYLHIQVVAPRLKPHNLSLLIPISVADFLVNIIIGVEKDPSNNNIM